MKNFSTINEVHSVTFLVLWQWPLILCVLLTCYVLTTTIKIILFSLQAQSKLLKVPIALTLQKSYLLFSTPIWILNFAAFMLVSCFDTSHYQLTKAKSQLWISTLYMWIMVNKCCSLTVAPSDGSWHEAASISRTRSWKANVSRLTLAHTTEIRTSERSRHPYECQDGKFCVCANLSPIQSLFHCIGRI